MKDINDYIIEKLKLDKNIKISKGDMEEEIINLLKSYGELTLDDVFRHSVNDSNGDDIDTIWLVNDTIHYSLFDDASGSKTINDLSEIFNANEIEEIYDFLNEK